MSWTLVNSAGWLLVVGLLGGIDDTIRRDLFPGFERVFTCLGPGF